MSAVVPTATATSEPPSENELAARAKSGDAGAFSELYERLSRKLVRFLSHFTCNVADAEDTAQDAWAVAWEKRAEYDAAFSFKTWLFGIGKWLWWRDAKKLRKRSFSRLPEEWEPAFELGRFSVAGPGVVWHGEEQSVRLAAAMELLGPDRLVALYRHYAEGESCTAIAADMGVKPTAVRARIHRAMGEVRRHFGIAEVPCNTSAS
jgi:RNA polymerase sigma-70 factor (ECF subfamily)